MYRAAVLCLLAPLAARADLVCHAPAHDAGTARTGSRLVHVFTLTNTGTDAVEILGVKAGCGCTSAVPATTRLAAGETTTLRIEVATVTQAPGRNAWRALVRHAGGELPLTVSATLEADVSLSPANLVLHASAGLAHAFTLTERRESPMSLRAVSCISPHLHAEAGTPRRDGAAWVRDVSVKVLPTLPDGRHEDALVIHADGHELRVGFSVVKRTEGNVRASPAAVEVSRDAGGAIPSRVILLHAGDDVPVKVTAVKASHPAIRARWVDGQGRATLRVTIDGTEALSGELAVEVNGRTVRVPVTVR